MRVAVVGAGAVSIDYGAHRAHAGDGDGLSRRNDWLQQDKPARSLKTIPN